VRRANDKLKVEDNSSSFRLKNNNKNNSEPEKMSRKKKNLGNNTINLRASLDGIKLYQVST